MSDWPDGWYRDQGGGAHSAPDGSRQAPPAEAKVGRAAWPDQPGPHSAPGRATPGVPGLPATRGEARAGADGGSGGSPAGTGGGSP